MKSFILVPFIAGCAIIIHSLVLSGDIIHCINEATDKEVVIHMDMVKEIV